MIRVTHEQEMSLMDKMCKTLLDFAEKHKLTLAEVESLRAQLEAVTAERDELLQDVKRTKFVWDEWEKMKAERAGVPIVLSSGFNEAQAVQRFQGKGLAGFLQKPYRASLLLEKIRAAISEAGGAGGAG